MKIKTLLLAFASLLITGCAKQNYKINLSGDWSFTTDSTNWNKTIKLPGSMGSNGLGEEITLGTNWTGTIVDSSYFKSDKYLKYRQQNNIKIPFWLQPIKYFKGVSWYKKEVNIPKNWDNKDISLFLERCHWETRLWIDDMEVGMQNSLGTPHRFDLTGKLAPGKHTITLRIDNRIKEINPGINSHSITDHTQGNWNGVIGKMYLEVKPLVNIAKASLYPQISTKSVLVKATLKNRKDKKVNATFQMSIDGQIKEQKITLSPGDNEVEMSIALKGNIKLWDEFHPNLYTINMCVKDENGTDKDFYKENFGFRDFKVIEGKLTINGRPINLRGTLDCAVFPKTGFPPTDLQSWKKIFNACVSHGLNHVRFHSWCPPKAAFIAADEMGLYLQIECSSWANQSVTIGDGHPLDAFIWKESEDIVREFGNHPSFCMMMYGNEPAGKNHESFLSNFVSVWKKKDSRRLYCSGSGWPNLPVNDYLSSDQPRIQRWGEGLKSIINGQAPRSNYDWSEYIKDFSQPMVSHEIGQWCVYPNFREIKKYDGVMRPKNLEIFQETLKENGMAHLADSFLLASGKLQALCYKADIEAALRTKDFGGFQLLGLYDFPGQGTALVGVLDAFWEEKGYISPEEYKHFCNSTVPLLRLPKFIYTNNESIVGQVEIAHYGAQPLDVKTTLWQLFSAKGKEIASGTLSHDQIKIGNCIKLGELNIPLGIIKEPSQLTLKVKTGKFENSWNIWCYPTTAGNQINDEGDSIIMTDKLDNKTIKALNNGGKVLLSLKKGSLSKELGGDIEIGFSSIFWNTAWTLGQAPHTLGILCNPKHPALKLFPTDYHSDYQWWDAMSHSGAIEIAKISPKIKPIVRVIDDWFSNRPLGLIFEAKVGKGSLIVSGIDFWTDMDKRIEAKQLLQSLKSYMAGASFQPQTQLSIEDINKLIQK